MSKFTESKNPANAVILAILLAATTGFASYFALYAASPPITRLNGTLYTIPLTWVWEVLMNPQSIQHCSGGLLSVLNFGCRFRIGWAQVIEPYGLATPLMVRAGGVVAPAIVAAAITYILALRSTTLTDGLTHLDGPRLFRGRTAIIRLQNLFKKEIARFGMGIWLAVGVMLPLRREQENLLIIGMPGSGKTMILRALIEQFLRRNDLLLIADAKGDMVAGLPAEKFVLLAPHDARSASWHVALDVTTWQAAGELASRMIRDSKDPMWSSSSRQVLAAMIAILIRTKPRAWTWSDLYDMLLLTAADLKEQLDAAGEPASRYINLEESGDPTKTSFGILVTLWASAVTVVRPLAEAWHNSETARFSVNAWIRSNGHPARVVILQRSAKYPELSEMLSGAMLETLAGVVADPALEIDPSQRLTLCIDEFHQLGRIKRVENLLAVGREKGLTTIAAIQTPSQLNDLYGEHIAEQLLDLLALKIVSRMTRGKSTTRVSEEMIGNRFVEWSETTSGKSTSDGKTTTTENTSKHNKEVPVFGKDRIEKELGLVTENGKPVVRALVLGLGDAYLLDWPLTIWAKRRQGHEPASWLKGEQS